MNLMVNIMLFIYNSTEAGTKSSSSLKAVPILRLSKIGTALFYVYIEAVVLQ